MVFVVDIFFCANLMIYISFMRSSFPIKCEKLFFFFFFLLTMLGFFAAAIYFLQLAFGFKVLELRNVLMWKIFLQIDHTSQITM